MVFSLFGGKGSEDKKATDESTTTIEEQTQKQTETTQEYTSEEVTTAGSSNSSAKISDELLLASLNANYEGQGTWKNTGDRQFTFYPEGDLASAFEVLAAYYLENGKIPPELEENYNNMCNSIKDLSKTMSDSAGEPCALSIANPSNTDNVLMSYINGVSVYNAFEE